MRINVDQKNEIENIDDVMNYEGKINSLQKELKKVNQHNKELNNKLTEVQSKVKLLRNQESKFEERQREIRSKAKQYQVLLKAGGKKSPTQAKKAQITLNGTGKNKQEQSEKMREIELRKLDPNTLRVMIKELAKSNIERDQLN